MNHQPCQIRIYLFHNFHLASFALNLLLKPLFFFFMLFPYIIDLFIFFFISLGQSFQLIINIFEWIFDHFMTLIMLLPIYT